MAGVGVLARWRDRLVVLASAVLLVLGVAVPPGLAAVRAVVPHAPAVQPEHLVPVSVVRARRVKLPGRVVRHTPQTTWPAAGTATVSLRPATAARPATAVSAAGDLPVKVAAAAGGVSRVRVSMASHAAAAALGVKGTVLTVARADGVRAAGKVMTVVDYASFAEAYGGDYASRLRLAVLPACALTTPEAAQCRKQVPLVTADDVKTDTLTATLTMTGTAVVVAADSTASGSGGDYTAPALPSSGEWTAGGSDGSFDYSYPVDVPKVPGGLEPDVSLEYDSQSLDGLTSSTGNQASWVGDGWDYSPGYVERDYQSCETAPPEEATWAASGDLCWSEYNRITLSLNGQNTVLVNSADASADDPADGTWHPQVDNGERVKYVTGGDNGTDDGGYWVITTEDGTSYYFGRDEIAGYASGDTPTDSAWTVPVYATSAGQPGYSSSEETATPQAWRWNLDYVTDRHGDAIAYFYGTEDNYYDSAVNSSAGDANEEYVQGGALTKIEYGLRAGDVYGYTPAGEVTFTTAADRTDIPSDLACTDGNTCDVQSPTFWDKYQLDDITTYARDGSALDEVNTWSLAHENLCTDDCTVAPANACTSDSVSTDPLWLESVTETAEDGTAIKLPATTFCGDAFQNRIESEDNDGYSLIYRNRLTEIVNDAGGVTTVNYEPPPGACVSGTLPAPDANTLNCYPDYWTESGVANPVESWFGKYVVAEVTEEDTTGDSPDEVTQYSYADPAWHYDNNPLIPSGQRTWDQWRGFKTVTTETGTAAHPGTETIDTYFQGMDGDHLSDGDTSSVTLTSSQGQTVTDSGQYAGIDFEHVVDDGPGGAMVTGTVTEPWTSAATADEPMPSPPDLESYLTGTAQTLAYTALASGVRESTDTYTHDSYGRVTGTSDVPDTSDASEDTCTTTSYATDTTDWILDLPAEAVVTSVPCGSAVTLPADAVSDTATFYDGSTSLSADDPDAGGNVTQTQEVTSYTDNAGTEDANWTTESRAAYDEYGRVLDSYDADDRETITAYSPATGSEPSTVTVTDPMGLATTTTYDPLLDTELTRQTPQGWTTTWTYDALGRVTAEWTPGHATENAQYKYSYTVPPDANAPWVTATGTLEPDGTDYLTSEVLYDSFGRPRETQDENAEGNTVVTDTSYDADGRKSLVSNAYTASGTPTLNLVLAADDDVPSQTGYDYDGAGRETAVISYELAVETSQTDYAYGGDYTTTTYVNDKPGEPDGGTPQTVFTDGRGLTAKIYQYHSEADAADGPGVSPGDYDVTSYAYTPAGKLAAITDAAGNKWTYGYDLAGDKTSETDPDTGVTTMSYDAARQLLTVTDARGKELTYTYNDDGLKTEVYDTTASSEIASWTYSDGELTSDTSYSGGEQYTVSELGYNGYGLPEGTETSIPAGEFKGDYTQKLVYNLYDDQEYEYEDSAAGGLPQEITGWSLDAAGEQTSLSSMDDTYVDNLTWTDLGQPLKYTWDQTGAWTSDSYDEETGALSGQDTYTGTSVTEVDALAYSRDNTGQLTEVSDALSGDTQCFGYDNLGRVSQAWSQTSATCGTPSVTAEAGATAPYWQTYSYNDENDLTSQTSTAVGGTVTTTADSYPDAGDSQPHALTSSAVTTAGTTSTTSTTSYNYDADGDLTTETGAASQTLDWDDAGRLSSDTTTAGTTSYIYDADGNLLITQDPGSDTLYLNDEEITYDTATGGTTAVRYYSIAGSVAASRTVTDDNATTTTTVDYLTGDISGTSTLAINAGTLDLTRRYYDPYGNQITSSGTWEGNKGFDNGAADTTTGLDDLGAREYNPATGEFISADPILTPDNPQDLNPYAYASDAAPTDEDPDGACASAAGLICPGGPVVPPPSSGGGGSGGSGGGSGQQQSGNSDGTGGGGCGLGCIVHAAGNVLGGAVNGVVDVIVAPARDLVTLSDKMANAFPCGMTQTGQLTFCNDATPPGRVFNLGDSNSILYQGGYIAAPLLLGLGGEAAAEEGQAPGITLSLRYKEGWSAEQIAAADSKVAALNAAAERQGLVVTQVERSGTSAASIFRSAGGTIPPGYDVDHIIDLQLGGADDISNMNLLDSSVNRSLGAQIARQLQGVPAGTCVAYVMIC